MTKKGNSLLIFLLVLFITSCNSNGGQSELPANFKVIDHNPANNEIMAVQYNDEMQIIVADDISKEIKKTSMFGGGPMKITFDAKFPLLKEKFEGKNPTKLENFMVNDHLYIHRSFEYGSGADKGYCEYGAMYIKEPEAYYEFYISGDHDKKEQHRPAIVSFLETIK